MAGYTVLGASGFVGRRVIGLLNAAGESCYAPTRDDRDIFERDLGRVFFCVGLTADYFQRPFDTVDAHVHLLAEILAKARFDALVYLSSTRLYDTLPPGPVIEQTDLRLNPANPRHLYDLTKALGENLCLTASGKRASVARLSCVYDAAPGAPGFLSGLLQRLHIARVFSLDSYTGITRDYVTLDDTVHALKAILDSGRCEIFNVASGENVSNQDIVDTLNACGCEITVELQSEPGTPAQCDIAKIRALGVNPVAVRDYLKSFLAGIDVHAAR